MVGMAPRRSRTKEESGERNTESTAPKPGTKRDPRDKKRRVDNMTHVPGCKSGKANEAHMRAESDDHDDRGRRPETVRDGLLLVH